MEVKTSWSLAQCQISWFHPTSGTVYLVSDPGWRGGGCQPLLPGPLPLPNHLPEEDLAVADQYLEAETMTVKAEGELQPQLELFRKQLQVGPLLPGAGHHDLAAWTA